MVSFWLSYHMYICSLEDPYTVFIIERIGDSAFLQNKEIPLLYAFAETTILEFLKATYSRQ